MNRDNSSLHCHFEPCLSRCNSSLVGPLRNMLVKEIHGSKIPPSCAIEASSSLDVVRFLINETSPRALSCPDSNGKNVLHYVQRLTKPETASLLVDQYPEMLLSCDPDGKLPIHYAMKRRLPRSVVRILVEKCPESLAVIDNERQLAIHFLSCPLADVQLMMVQYCLSHQSFPSC